MKRISGLAVASLLLTASASSAALADGEKLPPDRAPSLMTGTEIRAYNEGLDPAHPYYIRCKKDAVVGSLVRKLRVCRTNEEWKRSLAMGDTNGREILEDMSKAPVSGNTPGFDACPANRC